ncbi:MAG: DUF2723 domain-containing protein [Flavobacteriaceae bacterium]|nr:DUF2723 domain-containing protein [Flavobacteriaceae bacterium]
MNLVKFRKWETILGWIVFAISLVTYTLTMEPTVSFWDCGEYISTSVNLEVGHPPGAPLYQILGAFFAMFALDVTGIASMVNFMSAISSAFTILFLFWSITILLRKLITRNGDKLDQNNYKAILASGVVGALSYTFSDSFWFSAVEAEVYAMSSMLMALLLYLALRWEADMHKPRGHKWLLMISYVVGLSFGVHVLTLLVIPSIVFIYIFKNYKDLNKVQFVIANIVSIAVLAFIFKFLFPFTLLLFSVSELFFINTIGLPFNSGTIIVGLGLIALFYFLIRYSRRKNLVQLNTIVLSILFVMIGFSSWMMLPIRANAKTIINENNPSSARELLAYYNREQYGDANVFYDKSYTFIFNREQDADNPYKDAKPKYEKDEKAGKYIIVNNYKDADLNFSDRHKGFMPRMVNTSSSTIKNYIGITGNYPNVTVKPKYEIDPVYQDAYPRIVENFNGFMTELKDGNVNIDEYIKYIRTYSEFLYIHQPTFIDNMSYMARFQISYMYLRYFMWNFVGKQNDVQGNGNLDIFDGNWISGIDYFDEARLGSQDSLPTEISENKGRAKYYFLPFILGFIGLFYQVRRDEKSFYVTLLFFLFTGLAVIFYTNQKPFEVRERDYAVVGSFYIFALWIGIGVFAIYEKVKNFISPKVAGYVVGTVCLLAVPVLMASENWAGHDRSGRYLAQLNGKAYMASCQENAILFTIGDNDTFPLWYAQQVEGFRTDIKLVNTSLLATDWYIDQMKSKTYKAEPIPSQLTHDDYKYGSLEIAYNTDANKEQRWDIKDFMTIIQSKSKRTYIETHLGHKEKTYTTNKLRIYVDKAAVLRNKIVPVKDSALIVPYIDIDIDPDALSKNRIMMLDILANNNWERPIYFTGGASAAEEYIWLKDYLQLDGLALKFVPIKTPSADVSLFDIGRIDTDIMYKNMMAFDYNNVNNPDLNIDEQSRKISITYRNSFLRLAEAFMKENNNEKAKEVLDFSLDKFPIKRFGHYSLCLGYPEYYYRIDDIEKARECTQVLLEITQERLVYYSTFSYAFIDELIDEIDRNLYMYKTILETAQTYDSEEYNTKLEEAFVEHIKLFETLMENEELGEDVQQEEFQQQETQELEEQMGEKDSL